MDNAIVVIEAVHAKMEHSKIRSEESNGACDAGDQRCDHRDHPCDVGSICSRSFMPGSAGVFYKQFSLTIAVAIVLSGVVALTLTPALCAMMLKRPTMDREK